MPPSDRLPVPPGRATNRRNRWCRISLVAQGKGARDGAEPKAAGPHVAEGPCARPRRGVCVFASLPRPSPGTLADRDGVCEVSVRGLHAAPSVDVEPIAAVGMRRRAIPVTCPVAPNEGGLSVPLARERMLAHMVRVPARVEDLEDPDQDEQEDAYGRYEFRPA